MSIAGGRQSWVWFPLAFAAAYVVELLVNFRSLIHAIYLDPDIAAGPVIGQLIDRAPHGAETVLGNVPWYSEVWFEELTRWLPAHRQLWEIAPWALGLVGIGFVAWATARVAGRWAGAIVAIACGCGGSNLLNQQFGWSAHGVAYVAICLYGASVVWIALSSQSEAPVGVRQVVVLGVLTLFTGIQLACDNLVLIAGLVPFALAGGLLTGLLPHARRGVLARVLPVVVGSLVVAVIATRIAHDQNLTHYPFTISLVAVNLLLSQFGDLIGSVMVLAGGNAGGGALSFTSACELLGAAAALAGIWAAIRVARRTWRETAERLARSPGANGEGGQDRVIPARLAFLAFWLISALVLGVAFWISNVPVGVTTERYVVTCAYAVVVILATSVGSAPQVWSRLLLGAGVSVVVLCATVNLVQRQDANALGGPASALTSAQLVAFARAHGLTYGYGGYEDSLAFTWESKEAVQVFPVQACSFAGGLCSWPYHRISSWYTARPATPTFLIIDPTQPNGPTAAPAALGQPTTVAHIGPLNVYVYSYDIASRIQLIGG